MGPCESFHAKNCQYFFWAVRNPFSDFWQFKKYFRLLDPVLSELGKERGREIYQFKLWTQTPAFWILFWAGRSIRVHWGSKSLPPISLTSSQTPKSIQKLNMGRCFGCMFPVGVSGAAFWGRDPLGPLEEKSCQRWTCGHRSPLSIATFIWSSFQIQSDNDTLGSGITLDPRVPLCYKIRQAQIRDTQGHHTTHTLLLPTPDRWTGRCT